jgi:hypothetical protein
MVKNIVTTLADPLITCISEYVALSCQTYVMIDTLHVYSLRDSWNQPFTCTILLDNVYIGARHSTFQFDIPAHDNMLSVPTLLYMCCKRPSEAAPWLSTAQLIVGQVRYTVEWIIPGEYKGCIYIYPVPTLNIEVLRDGQSRANGFVYEYIVDVRDHHLEPDQVIASQDKQLYDYQLMTIIDQDDKSGLCCCRK